MTIDPVSFQPMVAPDAPGPAWVAQDFSHEGPQFLAWFAALQKVEPAFVWSALLTRDGGAARAVAQSQARDSLVAGVATLADTAQQEGQLKLSVVHGTASHLTAMACPLAGSMNICVVAVDRKLVEASRLSSLFVAATDQLSEALTKAQRPSSEPKRVDTQLDDAGLIDLLTNPVEGNFAQDLFKRLTTSLSTDHAILAAVSRKGRVTILRSTTGAEQMPRGSRAGQQRHAAIRHAASSQASAHLSWLPERPITDAAHAAQLPSLVAEESIWRAATLAAPFRGGDRLVWLGLWDNRNSTIEGKLEALLPQWQRLGSLLQSQAETRRESWLGRLPAWLDPRGWRLWLALATVGAAVWLFMPAPLLVVGEATLRSSDQRALVAPRDGFLSAVHVHPGDSVEQGQVLAEFDTRELTLRQSRITAQIAQGESRRMAAMASFNTAMVLVSDAEIDALSAERDLVALLLDQSRVVAGGDGVVVSGDMGERVGTAMRHGEPMFQLAQLDGFTVAVDVPQKDITEIEIGMVGGLKLTALPFDDFPIAVDRLSLGTSQADGSPGFTAIAELGATHSAFRPGMRGVAHIEAGQSVRAWVLLRDLVYWGQLQWWRWVP